MGTPNTPNTPNAVDQQGTSEAPPPGQGIMARIKARVNALRGDAQAGRARPYQVGQGAARQGANALDARGRILDETIAHQTAGAD